MSRKSPFIESIRRFMRLNNYSIRTEHSYLYWIRYFFRFHKMKHPSELGNEDTGWIGISLLELLSFKVLHLHHSDQNSRLFSVNYLKFNITAIQCCRAR